MKKLPRRYKPDISKEAIGKNIYRLLTPGAICNRRLAEITARLAEKFTIYADTYPHGLWAPGLAITNEMRALTELRLPLEEIRKAFDHLFALGLKYSPLTNSSIIHTATTWLDALQKLQPCVSRCDPAALLHRLQKDENFRIVFLFDLFLPKRHGGNFYRYSGQSSFLRKWVEMDQPYIKKSLRCLDAACGTGETTYELALLLLEKGFPSENFEVHGSTIEPLELFAAAHNFFPHDLKKQQIYRDITNPLFTTGTSDKIVFYQEDITRPAMEIEQGYDLILCNGLLGGPFVHTPRKLASTAAALAGRLNPGGILLAADTFHSGWKKIVPPSMLKGILSECCLRVNDIEEGIVAERRQ
jgi:chemotaxis methyl-accepting protein methylase